MQWKRNNTPSGVNYPSKKGINLAKWESNTRELVTLAVGSLVIVLLSGSVAKFGVIDQLERQRQVELAYQAVHSQYVQLQQAIEEYPQVELEYRTYSRNWMRPDTSGSFVAVDRMDVLDLLQHWLMPYGQVNAMTVHNDTVTVDMSGMNLEEISQMFVKLQQQPIVSSALLNIASTARESVDDTLDFTITITLQAEETQS